ncbi:oxygen-insensitive NAD(P)H nitroreductase [Acinetobacter pollinis]|uniref:oxygen-insensitive NAD(P)H nitroreductase n=1 Tax=Acinetobacter pollinis TaxID=2605270 RepID=UPI0018A2CA27|nr:oxygen-insensitive NAD(P)H nitroreductase [Acinetobacter pollinis]MBF7689411.1 oxygen-insensitive NAD(P)H nitroreductase [Acinetobacter pollinis]MBF7696994.1 oxygen-insensitive NAD(P)H nitroreductase [Acinetobacter pollinis]
MDILKVAQTRYTTKAYNSEKKIPQATLDTLLETLRLTPSSVNIQPWHFFVIETDEAKARVAETMPGNYSYNATKVLQASHSIVFCTKTNIPAEHLEALLKADDHAGRFKNEEARETQANLREGYVIKKSIPDWLIRQTYIALGQFLIAAAAEGIDSTAMEGFDNNAFDQAFDLKEKGLQSLVVVSLGYRSETDFNAKLPKSRLPHELVFTHL